MAQNGAGFNDGRIESIGMPRAHLHDGLLYGAQFLGTQDESGFLPRPRVQPLHKQN